MNWPQKEMLFIVPSRGRPEAVRELVSCWNQTTSLLSDLVIVVDTDDPKLAEYVDLGLPLEDGCNHRVWMNAAPRKRLGGTLNEQALHYSEEYLNIGFMGDDHRPRTVNFDSQLYRAMHTLGHGVIYGNDLHQGGNLPTAVMMSSRIIKTLGYMAPAGLVHFFLDNAWKAWGEGMGRCCYLPDTVIEHLHPDAGKAEVDEGYTRVWGLLDEDRERWEAYADSDRLDRDIGLLKLILE